MNRCGRSTPFRCLGLTGCRKVGGLVEGAVIQYSANCWSGALNIAASLHFLAISPHGDTLDFKPHESPPEHELVEDPWIPVDGALTLRAEPGLRLHIREEAVGSYAFE